MSPATPFAYVRETYGAPAAIGRRVIVDGKPGVIAEDRGHYIGVNFDAHKPGDIRNAHPAWKVEYLHMGSVRPMTRSQRRYSAFLDADSSLSFGEWLKYCAGRAA
jgi:hypothetical protein